MSIQDLPALNASLNGVATCLLLAGYFTGKRRMLTAHRAIMVSALVVSAAFLTSYLTYHFNTAAVTRYEGQGILRWIYFSVLITHIPLATIMVPFIFMTFIAGWRNNVVRHRQLVRWVWPVWLYVSITGVVIYIMLYQMP